MAKTHRIDYEKYVKDLMTWLDENGLKIKPFPVVRISNRSQDGVFIKTGHYDPNKKEITVFVNGRHIKDVLRTVAHECVHHNQNLEGRLVGYNGDKTSEDDVLTRLESEAYVKGNIFFRNWTEEKTKSEKPEKSFGKHMKKKITVSESMGQSLPKTVKARINRLYAATRAMVKGSYNDEYWSALQDYSDAASSCGGELSYWCENGGYCDFDDNGTPWSKQYEIEVSYPDGIRLGGYIKMMAAGTVEDPFSRYDTSMVVWKKADSEPLNEDMTKREVENVVDKAISDYIGSRDFKNQVTNIAADVAEEFVDNLFARKAFWKGAIRRR